MKPQYSTLKKNHYSSNELNHAYLNEVDLYKEVGLDYHEFVKNDPNYKNTCAVRMSLALLKCGVPFSGRIKIKSGPYVDKSIEPGAKLLADQLMKPTAFGRPQVMPPKEASNMLKGKKGLVFFWKIAGYGGGHIDLIEATNTTQVCHSACYFVSKEVWFWPLP